MKRPIGVLGTGSFGTVVTGLLLLKKNPVLLWDIDEDVLSELTRSGENKRYLPGYKLPSLPETTSSLEEICRRCDILFSVLPAKAVRSVMRKLGDYVQAHQIVVSCTKGLESDTLKRMTQVIEEETPLKKIGALSGPNLAREIATGSPSTAVIASFLNEVIEEIHGALNSRFFRVFGNHDPIGVEYCGSLKNIYAIASGIAQGLGYGINARAFLLTVALKEMQFFSLHFQAHPETFSGMAGVGDLIATATSELSRNFRFGIEIAKGKSAEAALADINQTVEGYHTVQALHQFLQSQSFRLPIVEAVYNVVNRIVGIEEAIAKLLHINVLYENDIYV